MIHLVMTSFAGMEDAERIGRQMVEAGLAACVNLLPAARSVYRFRGRVETDAETLALFKTGDADALIAALADAHPYELPVIEAWPVARASAGVAEWIAAEREPLG